MATKSQAKQGNESEIKATNLTKEDRQFIEEHGDQLSRSTQNAKWIHSPEERGDRPGQTLATRSPEVIRAWAEERGGRPATVPDTNHDGHAGVLRITFAQEGNSRLEEIIWMSGSAPSRSVNSSSFIRRRRRTATRVTSSDWTARSVRTGKEVEEGLDRR